MSPMRVIAKGEFEGRQVEVTWRTDFSLEGPDDVLQALRDMESEMFGTTVGIGPARFGYIRFDFFEKYFGFTAVALRVLKDAVVEYPDREPTLEERTGLRRELWLPT